MFENIKKLLTIGSLGGKKKKSKINEKIQKQSSGGIL